MDGHSCSARNLSFACGMVGPILLGPALPVEGLAQRCDRQGGKGGGGNAFTAIRRGCVARLWVLASTYGYVYSHVTCACQGFLVR